MKQKIIKSLLILGILTGITYKASAAEAAPQACFITSPVTSKASSRSIHICWGSSKDASVKTYYVMKRNTKNSKGAGNWQTIAKVPSDGVKGGPANSYTDQLASTAAQQYEYKICTLSHDGTIDTRKAAYTEKTDSCAVLGTNIKICIDPGHYGSLNNNYEYTGKNGSYQYSEAKFTLKLGTALQKHLKNSYGIDSYMTRTDKSISLTSSGRTYTNAELDQKNISVRGHMAKVNNCNFFISLHTNSTSRETNPWNQPDSINKVYVFVNNTAHASSRAMKIANSIGLSLTDYNQKAGIQTAGFQTASKNKAVNFTNLNNDSSNTDGTVLCRKSNAGSDYYGVLRGSSADGIEGILVEHAFHVTQSMRRQAEASDALCENWAACDAYGIAYGFRYVDTLRRAD